MNGVDRLSNWSIKEFEEYNAKYDSGAFRGSEATKYDLKAIKTWIGIRDSFKFTNSEDDMCSGKWKYLMIVERWSKTRYGTNYIFIDEERKLWRIRRTGDEFYGNPGEPYV